jgi:ubiquinone biosynthesis protein
LSDGRGAERNAAKNATTVETPNRPDETILAQPSALAGRPLDPPNSRGFNRRRKSRTTRAGVLRVVARWIRTSYLVYTTLLVWLWVSVGRRFGLRADDPRPAILRRFLERTGGTWIKLGQILAMRSDFLPKAFVAELSELLDNVPPFPYEVAKATIEADFDRPIEQVFAEFPVTPLAAASFGQVYRARLPSGDDVAVKVMRPGLYPMVRADLIQLRYLGFFVDTFRLLGSIRLKTQIDQLEQILYEELDYKFEADNIRRAVDNSRYVPIMKIPKTYDDFCTARVLTMEFLSGIWIKDLLEAIRNEDLDKLAEFRASGLNRELVARRIFDIGLRHLFEVGVFHADPHASNIVVLTDNVIGYVDFGIVGQMDEELAEAQGRYLEAVKDNEINDAARALSETIIVPERCETKLPEFRARLGNQIRDWIARVTAPEASLREKSIARLLLDNLELIGRYGFELSESTMRYYRALIIADVVVLQIDPAFDTVRGLQRYFHAREVRRLRQRINRKSLLWTSAEYFDLWLNGPRLQRQLSRFLRRQEETFGIAAAQYTALFRGVASVSLLGFLIVVIAGVFGATDLQRFIGFPFSLDWRWFAPFLLACWRVAWLVTRS